MAKVIALTLFMFELQLDQSKVLPDKITFLCWSYGFWFCGVTLHIKIN